MYELQRFQSYDNLKWFARKNARHYAIHPVWKETQFNQALLTDLELKSLGITDSTEPKDIPGVNTVQNLEPINPRNELGLIEIIGPPGGGKDTLIRLIENKQYPYVNCTPEEGYFWTHKDAPFENIRERHFRAYGGTEMEIDDAISRMTQTKTKPTGAILLNRSFRDNFWAFGYSFFLAGHIGIKDLLLSQKFFHFFQYSPTIKIGDDFTSVENLTAATFVLMPKIEQSLERKKSKGTGRILNLDFLTLLYTQYLRMISRLTTMKVRNLAILDMSGPLDQSISLFEEAFNKVVKI